MTIEQSDDLQALQELFHKKYKIKLNAKEINEAYDSLFHLGRALYRYFNLKERLENGKC